MEEKLQQIIDKGEELLSQYENQVSDLEHKMVFYSQHNLSEELRIARVKHDSLNLPIYRWRKQQESLKDLLDAWNS